MIRRTRTTLTFGLALSFALLAACDDSGEQRKDGAPATPDGKANVPGDGKVATPPALQKYKTPAEAIGAYNKCYSDCFHEKTSATNRETCKLDCDSLVEAGMDTLKDEPSKATYKQTWTTLRGCITGCWDDRKLNETNRATCLLTCSDAAEVSAVPAPAPPTTPGTPPGTPPATKAPTPPPATKAPTPPTTPPAAPKK
jgi:hypothetical protein